MKISFYFESRSGSVERRIGGDAETAGDVGIAISIGEDMDQLFVEPMIHTCEMAQDAGDDGRTVN